MRVAFRPLDLKPTWASPLRRFFAAYLLNKLWTDFHGLPYVCALHITQNERRNVSKIATSRSNFTQIPPLPGANASHSSCALRLERGLWTVTNLPANQKEAFCAFLKIIGDSIQPMNFSEISSHFRYVTFAKLANEIASNIVQSLFPVFTLASPKQSSPRL